MPLFSVKNLNRSTNIITTNTEYTIDPQSNIEETTLYYYQTLEVGKHRTMDPIMEGIRRYPNVTKNTRICKTN